MKRREIEKEKETTSLTVKGVKRVEIRVDV